MKKYLIFMFICAINFVIIAQKNTNLLYPNAPTKQSSIYGNACSYLAVDGKMMTQSSSITLESFNPFWTVSLSGTSEVSGIKLTVPDTTNNTLPNEYYIVFSLDSIYDTPITPVEVNYADSTIITDFISIHENIRFIRMLTDPRIYTICVPRTRLNQMIDLGPLFVRHICIISPVKTQLEIIEFEVFGKSAPNYNDDGGITGHQIFEDCNDYFDNNFDGYTDCLDYNCKVQYTNIKYTKPTCPVCNDGKMCITAMNVNKISFDGGISWVDFNDRTMNCFDNLEPKVYNIVFQSQGGCFKNEILDLSVAVGTSSSICTNGDFENGNFDGYTFETGFNESNPSGPHILNPGFNSNVHNIINVSTFSDPIVGGLINNPGFLGKYIFRLGDPKVIGSHDYQKSQMESIKYKFTVTNPDFSFNFARVTNDPSNYENHSDNDLPFFYWEITDLEGNIIHSEFELSNNVSYQNFEGGIRFKAWDCAHADLSNYIGQEVCIRLINSDCGEWSHWAYTYIDNLCSPSTSNIPLLLKESSCNNQQSLCEGQSLSLDYLPGGYNSYTWKISKLDASGSEYEVWQSTLINGIFAKLTDVVSYYTTNSGYSVICGDKLRVIFTAYNGCSSDEDIYIFDYICHNYTVDYCNPMTYCKDGKNITIQGAYDCPNCNIKWEPANYLFSNNVPFPTIKGFLLNPYTKTYNYLVNTQDGCTFCGDVNFVKYGYEIIAHKMEKGYCSYTYGIDIKLSESLAITPNNKIIIRKTNIISGETELLYPIGSGSVRTISFSQLRDSDTQFRLEVMISPEECSDGNTCKQSYTFNRVPMTSYHAYWKAAFPNTFSPNGDGQNDLWYVTFRSLDENLPQNCADMSEDNSSIFEYSVKIWDRWGNNLVFSQSISKSILDVQGFTGEEIVWDGTFNGQPVAEGVYVAVINTSSCYNGTFYCNDCYSDSPFQYCYGNETDCGKPYEGNPNNFGTKCGITVVR